MAIHPTPPHANIPANTPLGPNSQRKHSARDDSDTRAAEAEREAHRRMTQAAEDAQRAERDAAVTINNIRDSYERATAVESARQDAALENQKLKGYEAVREAQRAQQAELARVRREGERELTRLKDYYHDAINTTERTSRDQLKELQASRGRELNYEQQHSQDILGESRADQMQKIEHYKNEADQKVADMAEGYHQQYERMRATANEANDVAEKRFLERHATTTAQQTQILADIDNEASHKIREIRQDTAHKLAAYSSRQSDPFYKMVDINARLDDDGDSYILRATIPEHEQQHVSVSIKGDQIVLSGNRRNEEKLDLSPGHAKSTSSYQSFQESFPLPWPVDSRQLTKVFDGDELIASVPKKNKNSVREPYKAPKPERARVERPKFPENLPVAKVDERPPEVSPKTRGSRTLT